MSPSSSIKTGERRTATILFADMKGFTALSESLDPEEMDAIMGRVFGAFEEIIRANGGAVEKYIGDALVAVFGVPELHEDDSRRAIESALAFLERSRGLSGDLTPRGADVRFRIGIHAGLVATGTRGDFEVVTGHAMAVAQRLEAAAEPDGILVSDAVKERCEREFEFDGPRQLSLKGTSGTVAAWAVLGPAAVNGRDAGPFVGRKDALDELLRAYLRHDPAAVAGRFIAGDAGIGKTRLVQALTERVRLFPDFASPVLAARAHKYRATGYGAVSDAVLGYLELEPGAGPPAVAAALSALPGVDAEIARRASEFLSPGGAEGRDGEAVRSLFTIFSAIMERCRGAVYSPLLFIDDAQYLDRPSREFYQYFLKNAVHKPFVLMAGRDHSQQLRDAFPDLKPLRLGPLSPPEARELALATWPECGEQLLGTILSQSTGNPLFLREYALYARKHRDLSNLPGTVQNLFLTELERYEPGLRDFLRKMSAFAHHFNAEEARRVLAATEGEPGIIDGALKRLERDGVLVRTGDDYSFALDVLKRALYASLLDHNKKVIHGIVADLMLERGRPHRLRLIHHLVRAERWAEAAAVMRRDPACNYTYEYLGFIDALYRRLAAKSPDDAVQLLILKSALYFNSGKVDEAERELKRIMKVAITERNDNCMGFAYHLICAHAAMSYSFQKALFTGQKALYYYGRARMAARSVQNVMRTMAWAEMQRNDFEEARDLVDRMGRMPDRDEFECAYARAELALLSGDYRGALAALGEAEPAEHAEAGAELVEADDGYAAVTKFFGMDLRLKALWQLCDFRALGPAADALLEGSSLSHAAMAQAHAMRAASAALYGDREASREGFMQADFYAEQIRNDFDRVEALRTLALCLSIAGMDRKAESTAREALVLGLRHSCYYPAFTVVMLLVQMAVRRGDPEEARFFLREGSYFFTTGLLLPSKDVILYYYHAGVLLGGEAAERSTGMARSLLEDEKARIGESELVANFLATRGFGDIQNELDRHRGRAEGAGA